MNDFIAQHPELAITALGSCVGVIGGLLSLLIWMLKKSLDNMAVQIADFRKILGPVLDRLTKQETICAQHREHCPWGNDSSGGSGGDPT